MAPSHILVRPPVRHSCFFYKKHNEPLSSSSRILFSSYSFTASSGQAHRNEPSPMHSMSWSRSQRPDLPGSESTYFSNSHLFPDLPIFRFAFSSAYRKWSRSSPRRIPFWTTATCWSTTSPSAFFGVRSLHQRVHERPSPRGFRLFQHTHFSSVHLRAESNTGNSRCNCSPFATDFRFYCYRAAFPITSHRCVYPSISARAPGRRERRGSFQPRVGQLRRHYRSFHG